MNEHPDMSTPVTRGELRTEIRAQDERFDQKLETWAGALIARMDAMEQRMIQLVTTLVASSEQRMTQLIASQRKELNEDLARHVGALEESMRTMVSAVDDKYADLPGRVTALERNGSPPALARKRARRRRAS